ncbi:DNA cytosine methyltransferase [Streptomyces sp. MBT65]|uniref:DNA cytosine methyltransferase n=1 Tax=unclassified Streptomyces TaxID=2593676 RepID=UPI00190959D6|nr:MULTISPECIES: DNA cytosine methyltransferase [unclassified Streptomyces]MBK3576154.1 DNA cytosine methyltransferase [Streptomyces sp. MBT65]MBK3637218.1 DNA cytosine methyltransferase [Streptomyces sp. MBT97]
MSLTLDTVGKLLAERAVEMVPGQLAIEEGDALRVGSLCSGYGGLDMAVCDILGASVAWHCQYDPDDKHQYAARILAHHWPDVPNHGDITAVEWSDVEPVDVLTTGFPCQDVSLAGKRAGVIGDSVIPAGVLLCGNCRWGEHDLATCEAASPSGTVPSRLVGMEAAAAVAELNARDLADPAGPPPERVVKGNRSGLWFHVARAISVLRPRLVVIENVRGLLSAKAVRSVGPDSPPVDADGGDADTLRAIGAVLGDLADLGFHAEWHVQRASDIGAPHQRERVFIIAWPAADPNHERVERTRDAGWEPQRHVASPHRAPSDAPREGQPGQGARRRPTGSRTAAEDPDGIARNERGVAAPGKKEGGRARPDARRRGRAPATDPQGERRHQGKPQPEARGRNADSGEHGSIDWGPYAHAVAQWEAITGRPAPRPTDDRGRLTPAFVEWMMGLPLGHITGVPGLSRPAQLKALGNGVVPQQAAYALRFLLHRAGIAARFGLAA